MESNMQFVKKSPKLFLQKFKDDSMVVGSEQDGSEIYNLGGQGYHQPVQGFLLLDIPFWISVTTIVT